MHYLFSFTEIFFYDFQNKFNGVYLSRPAKTIKFLICLKKYYEIKYNEKYIMVGTIIKK